MKLIINIEYKLYNVFCMINKKILKYITCKIWVALKRADYKCMTNSLSFYNFLSYLFGNRFLSCWLLGFFRWSNIFSLSWWFLSCSFLSNNYLDNFPCDRFLSYGFLFSYWFLFNFFFWFWFIAKYAYVMMYLLVYWNKLKESELRVVSRLEINQNQKRKL